MRNRGKSWIALLLAAFMLLGSSMSAFAAPAEEREKESGISVAPINEAYLEYLQNGRVGKAPSTLDLSYLSASEYTARNRAILPQRYDLRETGVIGPMRNQGSYGTCWAFSALASVESGLLSRFPLADLSERHLAWFSYTGAQEEEANFLYTPIDPYNMGGFDTTAVAAMAAWKGPVFEEAVPYNGEAVDESLRDASGYHLQNAFYLAGGPYSITDIAKPSLDQIKEMIMEYGALSIDYYASAEDTAYNAETHAWFNSEKKSPDHAVTVVGWDDSFSRENFLEGNRPEGDGAWLVKNSWGLDWGDNGYFWLSYEDQSMISSAFYQVEAADNYQHNYQYDTAGWVFSMATQPDSTTAYASNVFTSEQAEQLEAVSFYTTDSDTRYEIDVYVNLTDPENPVSGTKAMQTLTGIKSYSGYYTIPLLDAVPLQEGETFSIVVKLANARYPYPIAAEGTVLPESYGEPKYLGNGGESYISTDGNQWIDIAGEFEHSDGYRYFFTNVCIKAFTNPISTVSFSQQEGPIAFGESVELTSPGADAVYYTTDGSDPRESGIPYEGEIVIDREMTIRAVAEKDGAFGGVREKHYTQAQAQLTNLLIEESTATVAVDLSGGEQLLEEAVTYPNETIRLIPSATGSITVNGVPVGSSQASQEIALTSGDFTDVTILCEEEGKTPVTYTIRVYRSALAYDYKNETVSFDEGRYRLSDAKGNPIKSGGSVTPYLVESGDTSGSAYLLLTDLESKITYVETLPTRLTAVLSDIDYVNERTVLLYGKTNLVSTSPDMSDAYIPNNEALAVTPGVNLYIQKFATDSNFASLVKELVVPDRPKAPQDPGIDFAAETTRDAVSPEVQYSLTGDFTDAAYAAGEPLPVIPGTELSLRYPATQTAFASEIQICSIPARPAAPNPPAVQSVSEDTVILEPVDGAEYRLADGEWQMSNRFSGLTKETAYTFEMRFASTDTSFVSLPVQAVVETAAQAQQPADPSPKPPADPQKPTQPGTGVSVPAAALSGAALSLPLIMLLILLQRKRRRTSR